MPDVMLIPSYLLLQKAVLHVERSNKRTKSKVVAFVTRLAKMESRQLEPRELVTMVPSYLRKCL